MARPKKQDITTIIPIVPQRGYYDSQKRFPCYIGGVGTGKTLFLLNKIMSFCKDNPKSRGLIVRKEYTDLRDSTVKDFRDYFGIEPDSNKEVTLNNGSTIMFRHGDELNVLKNITLDIVGIEQAEEFETDKQFIFLRDRLRGHAGPVIGQEKVNGKMKDKHLQQLCLIANACGHNWIWQKWVNNPGPEFDFFLATTFDNIENLDPSFIADMKQMEIDAPSHYRQYVMNSFEELGSDDLLIPHQEVYGSPSLETPVQGSLFRILGVDVARYGEDEIVFSLIESRSLFFWEQTDQQITKGKSTMDTVGRILDYHRQGVDLIVVDDCGVGGGVTDRLRELNCPVEAFNGGEKSKSEIYFNKRSEAAFIMAEMFHKGNLKILDDEMLKNQLTSLKFGYGSRQEKYIWSKERMRKEGLKSPDRADALTMACYFIDKVIDKSDRGYGDPMPRYGVGDNDEVMNRPGMPAYARSD